MKSCVKCKLGKDFTEYTKDRSRGDGLNTRCKPCDEQHRVEYEAKNPERVKAYKKQY
jgi:RNase P subunit RPR2